MRKLTDIDKCPSDKRDCHAYCEGGCSLLHSPKAECSFYKSKKTYYKDFAKGLERVDALPTESRAYIIDKYYKNDTFFAKLLWSAQQKAIEYA